jgi:hypothetical protein
MCYTMIKETKDFKIAMRIVDKYIMKHKLQMCKKRYQTLRARIHSAVHSNELSYVFFVRYNTSQNIKDVDCGKTYKIIENPNYISGYLKIQFNNTGYLKYHSEFDKNLTRIFQIGKIIRSKKINEVLK